MGFDRKLKNRNGFRLQPQWFLVIAALATILVGALLLSLPAAVSANRPMALNEAFFTATSAVCVTGLSVIDIGSRLSLFGQVVLLVLIQAGGLGIMTFATFMLVVLGRRFSMQGELVLSLVTGEDETPSVLPLLKSAALFSLLIEGVGTLILSWIHWRQGFKPLKALYYGVFHAVSAFCNAGFSLYPDSLQQFRTNTLYIATICTLILLGGIGFLVLHNIFNYRFWHRSLMARGRITGHSRMVIQMTLILVAVGTIAYLGLEWNNTIKELSLYEKVLGATLQSVSARTAGFSIIDMANNTDAAHLVTMVLMFVGGSPGSTSGGIKTTTMMVLIITIAAIIRGRRTTLYGERAIAETIVRQAIAIFLLGIAFVVAIYFGLLFTEMPNMTRCESLPLLFEVTSAFGTTGLSLDLTPQLSLAGRSLIMFTMLAGRLGPLTIAMVIGGSQSSTIINYPEEEIVVG